MRTLRDFNAAGKRVLVRVDFNVPIKEGKVKDETRVVAAIPTLKHLLDQGATLVLFSHLGRPKGGYEEASSLAPVAPVLEKHLGRPVIFIGGSPELTPASEATLERVQAVPPARLFCWTMCASSRARKKTTKNWRRSLHDSGMPLCSTLLVRPTGPMPR